MLGWSGPRAARQPEAVQLVLVVALVGPPPGPPSVSVNAMLALHAGLSRKSSAHVRLVVALVKRIESSLTLASCAGVTSFHVAVGGTVLVLNPICETWVPAMYMILPVVRSAPMEGSPEFCLWAASLVWNPGGEP